MTRFRLFGSRHVHRRPGVPAVTQPGVPVAHPRAAGTWPLPSASPDPLARHRVATASSVRNGLAATAVAVTTLALAGPTLATTAQPDDPVAPGPDEPATTLRLAAGDAPARVLDPATLRPTVLPAVDHAEALPAQLEVARLVKAAGLAQAAERAERRAVRTAAARCDADLDGLGRVKPWARTGARFLSCLYDEPVLDGVAERGVDFMVRGQRGDRIAACALANQKELGVDYVLWRQRANHGDGWERMRDRGGDTANHEDHVRITFRRDSPDGEPRAGRCR